ncbi:hydantoinase B/oxoprolinase family protein [uncultured Ruegeria sp.]|uniref:hydantoinase B/oxoprolinase family protein n=1 Tax=uncultured Ruegeria sp. TaxID=259304 RepID=UPI0026288FC5|nr:hydantoinase B/oxoprolinase family protein [uncultured Ruegeria sp.]
MSDPFTSSVLQSGLDAAAEEMFEVLRKSAMSPIIYEVLDVGTGVTDADGELVSSGAGIPSFIGVLDKTVKAILSKEGDNIAEGDVFVTNDPNTGGVTHLNDVVVAEPVFHYGIRVAWVASIAHWGDIGGKTPGSMAADATEIFAEGLRLPVVRLFSGGERSDAVFDIIKTNSRLPDFVSGDLWAQVSAGRRAARLIRRLCDRYGPDAMRNAILDARQIGEARARAGLSKLPKGSFRIQEPQDNGDVWDIGIDINDDCISFDLTQAPLQSGGPHNTSRDGAVIACQMFFKALTDPERFANAGSFAPLEVRTTPGTIFEAGPTAAHAYYFETRIRLFDALWHCMAKAAPGLLPAGHFGTIFGTVIAGQHPETGRNYAMVEPQMGGWGATKERAGTNAMYSTSHGDTFNCPIEIAEARYGFDVVAKELNIAPKNTGEYAGGDGVVTRYRMNAPATMSCGFSHAKVPVWSEQNASDGGLNSFNVRRENGRIEDYDIISGLRLNAGEEVEVRSAYGGSTLKA